MYMYMYLSYLLRNFLSPKVLNLIPLSHYLQDRFTQDMQPHYIYSPMEMTRWVRGIYEAFKPLETLPIEGLVRVWAHEALRLFQDHAT